MFLTDSSAAPDYLGKRECLVDSRLRVGCEEPRDGFLCRGHLGRRRQRAFRQHVRMLGARPTPWCFLLHPVRSVVRSSSTAGPSSMPSASSISSSNRQLTANRTDGSNSRADNKKRATWLDAPNRTPRLGLIPDRVRVIRPPRRPSPLVPRRRASPRRRSSPPRVQAVTRRPRRTAGRCLQRLLGCAGGLHARVVPPYDGPTQALRPHRGGSERPVR